MDTTSVRRTWRAIPWVMISALTLAPLSRAVAQGRLNACALLSKTEVEAVLVTPTAKPERSPREYGDVCIFRGSKKARDAARYVRIIVYRFASADDAEQQYNNEVNTSMEADETATESGLGDRAFSTITTDRRGSRESVTARRGRVALTIEVGNGEVIRAKDRRKALALARRAMARLQ